MSFVEKHCESSLSSWLIIDTLLIPKLFTLFVPICSQSTGSIFATWENSLRTKLTDFSAFLWMMSLLEVKNYNNETGWRLAYLLMQYNVMCCDVFGNLVHGVSA